MGLSDLQPVFFGPPMKKPKTKEDIGEPGAPSPAKAEGPENYKYISDSWSGFEQKDPYAAITRRGVPCAEDMETPVIRVNSAFFHSLAEARVEDDAPLLSG